MTYILILSNESDFALDRVIRHLRSDSVVDVRRFNRETPDALTPTHFNLGPRGWTAKEPPAAAWLRQWLPERDPYGPRPTLGEVDEILIRRRQWLAWTGLFGEVGTTWFNDPLRTHEAESKMRQLAVASSVGLKCPRSLVTHQRDAAVQFQSDVGRSIIKSAATAFWEFTDQSFVFTSELDSRSLDANEDEWTAQPVLIQERVEGDYDARGFYVAGSVVGARRPRTSLDWRTDPHVEWEPWDVDSATVRSVQNYASRFGLDYGAFDFILPKATRGEPVFLECNPSGEFGFLDDVLEGAPSRLIAQRLSELATSATAR